MCHEQNRTLSDDTEEILRLQGLSWLTRKAISMSSITLSVSHYTDTDIAPPIEHIDIEQTLTGGITGSPENRILDWTERQAEDRIFGAVLSKSRRTTLGEIDDEWLREGWTDDTVKDGVVQTRAQNDPEKNSYKWSACVYRRKKITSMRWWWVRLRRRRGGISWA